MAENIYLKEASRIIWLNWVSDIYIINGFVELALYFLIYSLFREHKSYSCSVEFRKLLRIILQ